MKIFDNILIENLSKSLEDLKKVQILKNVFLKYKFYKTPFRIHVFLNENYFLLWDILHSIFVIFFH